MMLWSCWSVYRLSFFFFNATATTEIYTLSLHDALPISDRRVQDQRLGAVQHQHAGRWRRDREPDRAHQRSEEHTSELQSLAYLVCRLLLEKTKSSLSTLPLLCLSSLSPIRGSSSPGITL